MTKLNDLVSNNKVQAYGFPAFKGLEAHGQKEGNEIVISTLSPAIMANMGINTYYAPVIPRDSRFNTADEVIAADLDVNLINVFKASNYGFKRKVIVTRHQGTLDILKEMHPNAEVMTGNVSKDDIEGAYVIGVLPPHLVQYAIAYQAATIKNFDYAKDDDLSGEELKERLEICEPISVEVK